MELVDTSASTTCEVRSLGGDARSFAGFLLGFGTSQLDSHIHPLGHPPPGLRCSGCRWTETRIWWSSTDSCYVVGVKGHTAISGEKHRYKSWWVTSAEGVLDVLLVTPPPRRQEHRPPGYRELPAANYEALEEAALEDAALLAVLRQYERESA